MKTLYAFLCFVCFVGSLSAASAALTEGLDRERSLVMPTGNYFRTPRTNENDKMRREAALLWQSAWVRSERGANVTTLRRLFTIAADPNHPLHRAAVLYLGHMGTPREAALSTLAAALAELPAKPATAAERMRRMRLERLRNFILAIEKAGSVTSQEWPRAFREVLGEG